MKLAFISGDVASVLCLEGPLKAGVRAELCLASWRWLDADQMARQLVGEALKRARAVRPSWNEGQPEHVIQAGTLVQRSRCVKCHGPLPTAHFKFCGRLCGDAHRKRQTELREGNEDTVVAIATRNVA